MVFEGVMEVFLKKEASGTWGESLVLKFGKEEVDDVMPLFIDLSRCVRSIACLLFVLV